MQINNFLENAAMKSPDNKAVWYKRCWTSYGQIDVLANKLANYLKEIGVSRGDRVAILYENSLDYIIAFFAVLKAGAVDVSLHTETTAGTLARALNHSGAKVLIADAKYSPCIISSLGIMPELRDVITNRENIFEDEGKIRCNHICLKEIYDNGKAAHPGVRGIDIDLASIVYTSGTTGEPKGVMLSHLNVVSNTRSIVRYLELTSKDRVMVVMPFCYKYGRSLLTTHFYVGGSVVIDNRFVFPQVVLETMRQTEVTGFAGVPSTFLMLLNRSVNLDLRCESLRYITQAGGSMAPNIQKKVAAAFAPARLFVMYGATEASPRLSYLDPADFTSKCGSVGKAISNVELFTVDEYGNRLPPNDVGEIVARGSNIMMGYWNDPVGTSKVLKDGLYHTGDIGKIDEDGYVYLLGRSDDVIKVNGFRVSLREVEHALLDIEGVHEATVIGVDDSLFGQTITAFVVPEEDAGLTKDGIKAALRISLPAFKQPTQIEFVSSIPKNASGKVAGAVLKEQYELLRKSANS